MLTPTAFIRRVADRASTFSDVLFKASPSPLLRGDLVAYAEEEYPRDKWPTMWTTIPDDLRREIIWDGRLPNGRMPAELTKSEITDEVIRDVVMKAGFRALKITGILAVIGGLVVAGGMSLGHNSTPYPSWAADNGAWMPVIAWYLLSAIETVGGIVGPILSVLPPILLLFPVFWFFSFAALMNDTWTKRSAGRRLPTRDTQLFWDTNAAIRPVQLEAYKREVASATGRLKDQPFIPVAKASGVLRSRGDNEAPSPDQIIGFDGESIRQHLLILGGTGAGKTRLVIRPLFKRLMSAAWGEGHKIGAYITDGKGTLWKDLSAAVSHRNDIRILGTEGDQYGMDLVQGMTPLEVSSTFKAVSGQVAGKPSDEFWPESASLLLMHSAAVAKALAMHEETVDEWRGKRRVMPYSLLGIAAIATEEATARGAIPRLKQIGEELGPRMTDEQAQDFIDALESAKWLDRTFLELAAATRSSIVANVNVVLGKLKGAREISKRFCSGVYERQVDVDHALKGGVVMVAVGETEHGMAGKVVNVWLKTRLYIMAKRRLISDPEGCKNTSCALFADEYQMLATTGPDSDATFWNIARETGVFLVSATQSLAALKQVIGLDASSNLVNLLRSKIILKTEELSTLEYAIELAGQMPRGLDVSGYATQMSREIMLGNENSREPAFLPFDGLLPILFVPAVTMGNGGVGSVRRIPKATVDRTFYSAKEPQRTSEDWEVYLDSQIADMKNGRNLSQLMAAEVQMRPKIDIDELLTGSGFAFAVIQRAGGDRTDLVDLDSLMEAA